MKKLKINLSLMIVLMILSLAWTGLLAQQKTSETTKTKPGKEVRGEVVKPEAVKQKEMNTAGKDTIKPEGGEQVKDVGEDVEKEIEKDVDVEKEVAEVDKAVEEMEKDAAAVKGKQKSGKQKSGKSQESQGNAYGKNKGGLEGKEFGQARAEEARMQQMEKEKELDTSITEAEGKVTQAREKIKTANEQLEKDKKEKKISDAEYAAKKEKIDKAEKATNDLEEKINKGKQMKEEK